MIAPNAADPGRHAVHAAQTQWLQVLRGPDGPRHPRRVDRRGGAERLRQVEPAGGAALGHGGEPPHGDARRRHGGRDLRRYREPAGAQLRRGVAVDRQCRAAGAGGVQRCRRDRDRAPDHPRRGLGLQGAGPRRAGARRADAVRRCLDRRAIPRAGAAGTDLGTDPREAEEPPPHPRGRGGDRRALPAPARGGAEAARGRGRTSPGWTTRWRRWRSSWRSWRGRPSRRRSYREIGERLRRAEGLLLLRRWREATEAAVAARAALQERAGTTAAAERAAMAATADREAAEARLPAPAR